MKKLVAVILSVVMMLSVAGCAKDNTVDPSDEGTGDIPLVRGVRYMYSVDDDDFSTYISGKIIDESKIGERIEEFAVTAGLRNNDEKIWITQETLRAELYSIDGISKNVAVALKAIDESTDQTLYYVLVNPDADYTEVEKYITYEPVVGISPLTGGTDIYPTVMVEGQLYEWRKGRAICVTVPEDLVYYGEVTYVYGNTPTKDCEFRSVFMVSGQIYTVPGDDELVYLRLTTDLTPDWLNDTVVIFDLE